MVTYTSAPDSITGIQTVVTDDITIDFKLFPIDILASASDSSFCRKNHDDTISLSAIILTPDTSLVNGTFTWTSSPANYSANLNNDSIASPYAIINGMLSDTVIYSASYAYGLCTSSDDVELTWNSSSVSTSVVTSPICLGDSTTIMGILGDTIFFQNPSPCSSYTVSSITYAPVSGTATNISLADDAFSTPISIGFDFDFYCNTYNQVKISSNGYITFDLSASGAASSNAQHLPDTSAPNNIIAFAFTDLNPGFGGSISHFRTGVPPNRQLIVNYSVPRVGIPFMVIGQIVLHEGTNYIDIHSTNLPANDSITTQGIENIDGTLGVTSPGYNQTSGWTALNIAYRFSIDNSPLFGPFDISWSPNTHISDSTIYNPTVKPLSNTTYYVDIIQKGCLVRDSIEILVTNPISAPSVSCGTVSNPENSVLFNWGSSPNSSGWEYSIDMGATWGYLSLQDSSRLITGIVNGNCGNIMVRALDSTGACTANPWTYLECCTIDTSVSLVGASLVSDESRPTVAYQWVDCNNSHTPIGGEIAQSFTPGSSGNYAVLLNDGINSAESSCHQFTYLDRTKLASELGISIFPNPTSGLFNIIKGNNETIDITINNNIGQSLYSTTLRKKNSSIDLSQYSSGVYFITFSTTERAITQKLIKY